MIWRRIVSACVAGTAVASLVGCGGGGETKSPPSTPVTSTAAPSLDPAVQSLKDLLRGTPEGIAADFTAYGTARVTAADVEAQAHALCKAAFLPFGTMTWLTFSVPNKNLLMLGPVHRLLELASTPLVCTRPASEAERQQYRSAMYSYLTAAPARLPVQLEVPGIVQQSVCGFLQNEAGGKTVEILLASIVDAVSRNRVDIEDFLPIAVGVVAQTCNQWSPLVKDVLTKYFTTSD